MYTKAGRRIKAPFAAVERPSGGAELEPGGLLHISQADVAKSKSMHVVTISRIEGAAEIRGAAGAL